MDVTMQAPDYHQRIAECGRQLAPVILEALTVDGRVQPSLLVAACARMAGGCMFRALGLGSGLAAGQVVLSEQAGEQSQLLIRTCANILAACGKPLPADATPDCELPASLQPALDYPACQQKLAPLLPHWQARFALDEAGMARALAVTAGVAIVTVAGNLTLPQAFALACLGFVEGLQTVPLPWPAAAG